MDFKLPSLVQLIYLALRSVINFLWMVLLGKLHLQSERLGKTYRVEDGDYRVFRETVVSRPAKKPVVLVVGFRLRFIKSLRLAHWLFQRVCILTTPFWSGFKGFGTKLWMVDRRTKNYLGIYQWDGEERAQTYVNALNKILHLVSTRGSVWYSVYPKARLGRFLEARRGP